MSEGNAQIQELIELGATVVKEYEFEVKGETKTLTWSPVKVIHARLAFYKALQYVSSSSRPYLNMIRDEKEENNKKKDNDTTKIRKPSTEEFMTFNHYHAVHTITYALMPHFSGITSEQVDALDLSHTKFHEEIAIASGLMKSKETIEKFPAEQVSS